MCLIVVVPIVVTMMWTGKVQMLDNRLHKSGYSVLLSDEQKMDMEEFVVCCVMAQLEPDAPDELVKTMMVIDRTKILRKLKDNTEISVDDLHLPYFSREQLEERFEEEIYEKNVVLENTTAGNVITYNGEVINPAYHAVSAGKTRAGEEEYLKPVDSEEDIHQDDYITITYYSKDEFSDLLGKMGENIEINRQNPLENLTVNYEDDTGYVSEVVIGNQSIPGDSFYKTAELNSDCFKVEQFNEAVRIITKGKGHGKGLSISGAKKMADAGKSYIDIIRYYYNGIELKSYQDINV